MATTSWNLIICADMLFCFENKRICNCKSLDEDKTECSKKTKPWLMIMNCMDPTDGGNYYYNCIKSNCRFPVVVKSHSINKLYIYISCSDTNIIKKMYIWLTEWLIPHMRTLSRGSLARNSFTFWATKCFFFVFVLLANDATALAAEAIVLLYNNKLTITQWQVL